jgi:hypothetical protein
MQCTHCGGTYGQLMPMIHQSGTQNLAVTHVSMAAPYNVQSFGTQQTHLAANCAPPRAPSPMPTLIAFVIGAFMSYDGWRSPVGINWNLVLVGSGLLVLSAVLAAAWYKQVQFYAEDKRVWQNTWVCMSCGRAHQLA